MCACSLEQIRLLVRHLFWARILHKATLYVIYKLFLWVRVNVSKILGKMIGSSFFFKCKNLSNTHATNNIWQSNNHDKHNIRENIIYVGFNYLDKTFYKICIIFPIHLIQSISPTASRYPKNNETIR